MEKKEAHYCFQYEKVIFLVAQDKTVILLFGIFGYGDFNGTVLISIPHHFCGLSGYFSKFP